MRRDFLDCYCSDFICNKCVAKLGRDARIKPLRNAGQPLCSLSMACCLELSFDTTISDDNILTDRLVIRGKVFQIIIGSKKQFHYVIVANKKHEIEQPWYYVFSLGFATL